MKDRLPDWLVAFLRSVPLLLCLALLLCYLYSGEPASVESLLSLIPETPLLSALCLLLLYVLKSLVAAVPVVLLYAAGGLLFPTWLAILINSAGLLAELVVPYGIGRLSGKNGADRLRRRHPRLIALLDRPRKNTAFTVFFLRIIGCLPLDVVSLYLGATGIPVGGYLLWSFLGSFPSLIVITLLGASVTDPRSPAFWLSAGLTVALSAVSLVGYHRHIKNSQRRKRDE